MSSNWSTVPAVADGMSANSINPALSALRNRTDYLKNLIDNLSGSCGTIFTDYGFSSDVELGTIVAWDGEKYIPAEPRFSDQVRGDGSLAPADSAYVVGVVISNVDVSGRATILVSGWISEPALISVLTNDSTETGAYYLSSQGKAAPGTATQFDIPVYCFSRTSTGKLIFAPKAPEYTGHSHGSSKLPADGWVAVEKSDVPVELQPSGTAFSRYVISVTDPLYQQLKSGVSNVVLTKNGIITSDRDWVLSEDNGTIYTAFEVNSSDELIIYLISPLQGKDPLVHSVYTDADNKLLKVTNTNGNVRISSSFAENTQQKQDLNGTAVLAIDDVNGVATGPVIHSMMAGPGIHIAAATDLQGNQLPGCKVISSSAIVNSQIDLQVVNLDGVLFGTDNDMISYRFPAGIRSSLFGSFRIPHYDSGNVKATLNVILRGAGESVPTGECFLTSVKFPELNGAEFAHTGTMHTVPGIGTTEQQFYYRTATEIDPDLITSDGLLNCRLIYNNPTSPITVVAVSIQLSMD